MKLLLDFVGEVLWSQFHPCQIVNSLGQSTAISLQELNRCLQCIINMDQWQWSILRKETCILLLSKCLEEDLSRVIGCAMILVFFRGHDAWIAETAEVDSELQEVITAEQFTVDLCDSIHGTWKKCRILRNIILRALISEGGDGRRCEDLAFVLVSQIKTVLKTYVVDISAADWLLLSDS